MEKYLKKLAKRHRSIVLTDRERAEMRLDLAAFMDEHPVRAPFLVRSSSFIANTWGILSSQHAYVGYRLAALSLVIVLVAGVGTTYAAENALPGDPLYGIKVKRCRTGRTCVDRIR